MSWSVMGVNITSPEVIISAGLTAILEVLLISRAVATRRVKQLPFFSLFVILFSFIGFFVVFTQHELVALMFPILGGIMPIWMIGSVGLVSNGEPVRDDDGTIKTYNSNDFDDGSDITVDGR